MRYLIQFILFVIGAFCLFVAYMLGYHPIDGLSISLSEPSIYITNFFSNMIDVKNIKELKQAYLVVGLFLVISCGGILFVNIGGGKKDDPSE